MASGQLKSDRWPLLLMLELGMCVLRVTGSDFQVDDFLRDSRFEPCAIFRRGDPKFPASQPNGPKLEGSGLNVIASDADFSRINDQIQDTIRFLENNHDEIARLVAFKGVEWAWLDFAIEERNVAAQCEIFPPKLLALAGNLGLSMAITLYPPANENESEDRSCELPAGD